MLFFWGNVEYVEYVECFWNLQALFLNEANKFPKHSTYSTFPQIQEAHFLKKMLLSVVMLNVVSPSGNWGVQKGPVSFKNIQHIQPIQHFRRKKHFLSEAFEHIQHIQHFCRKKHINKMLLSAVLGPSQAIGGVGGCGLGGCWAAKAESKLKKDREI